MLLSHTCLRRSMYWNCVAAIGAVRFSFVQLRLCAFFILGEGVLMKKAISILLSVILVFSCVSFSSMPVNAITDYTTGETEDGIFYRIDNETGELTVTWADFNTTDLVIPAYIDGKPVTTIGDNFLCDTPNPNLRSVVIPDSVKKIMFNAFANCIKHSVPFRQGNGDVQNTISPDLTCYITQHHTRRSL